MEVIYGPSVPTFGGVIYQVTLTSGIIVTSPDGFPDEGDVKSHRVVVVSVRGQLLSHPDPRESAPSDPGVFG